MVYKIKVIFTKEPQDINNYLNPDYEFLYSTDELKIKPGDLVKSDRYYTPIQIISINKCTGVCPSTSRFLEINEVLTPKKTIAMSELVSIIEDQVAKYMKEHPTSTMDDAIKKVTGKTKKNPMSAMVNNFMEAYKGMLGQMAPELDTNLRVSQNGVICVPTSNGTVIFFDPVTSDRVEAPSMATAKIPVYIFMKPIEQVVEGDILKLDKSYYRANKSYAAGDEVIKCTSFTTGATHNFKPTRNAMTGQKGVRCVMNNFGNMVSAGFNPMYMNMFEVEDGEVLSPEDMYCRMMMFNPAFNPMMGMCGGTTPTNGTAQTTQPGMMPMYNPMMGMMPGMMMPGMMPMTPAQTQVPQPQQPVAPVSTPVASVEKSMEDMSVEELQALLEAKKKSKEDAAKKAELIKQIKAAEAAANSENK